MFINIIESYRNVVAICDSEILGKRFEEPDGEIIKQLDVKENFYKGDEVSEPELVSMIKNMAKEDATFNIIGKKSIEAAIKAGLITEKSVGEISGIPYAMVLI